MTGERPSVFIEIGMAVAYKRNIVLIAPQDAVALSRALSQA